MRVNQLMYVRLMDINLEESWIELRLDGSKTHREWRVPIVAPLKPQLEHLVRQAVENGADSSSAILTLIDLLGQRRKEINYLQLPHYSLLNLFLDDYQKNAALLFHPIASGIH